MMVWIVLALMTGAAVLAVLLPLARSAAPAEGDGRTETDRAFYEAQIAEIERDRDRGLLEPAEAETAKVEAARRLLASARLDRQGGSVSPAGSRRRLAAVLSLVLVPAVSLGLYLSFGHPDMPAQPLAARTDGVNEPGGMDEAIAKIERHLAENPNDGRGFDVVAPVYMSLGRFDDAAKAYKAATRLLGEQPARLENYAEALIAIQDGIVSAEARPLLDKALAMDPRRVKARYFRAMAAEQDGDKPRAVAIYKDLGADAPPGSQLAAMVNERLAALGAAPPSSAPAAGPESEQGKAIAAMPKGDQLAMIRGMVEQLAGKLATNGADPDGWIRLVRSYVVLGEPDKARAALAQGRAALAGDSDGLSRLEALGRELSLGGS